MTHTQPLPYSLRNDHTSWSLMHGSKPVAERLTMLVAVRLLKIANAPHMIARHDKADAGTSAQRRS